MKVNYYFHSLVEFLQCLCDPAFQSLQDGDERSCSRDLKSCQAVHTGPFVECLVAQAVAPASAHQTAKGLSCLFLNSASTSSLYTEACVFRSLNAKQAEGLHRVAMSAADADVKATNAEYGIRLKAYLDTLLGPARKLTHVVENCVESIELYSRANAASQEVGWV